MQRLTAIFFLVCLYQHAGAQNGQWDKAIHLKSCRIEISADMFTATTFIEMEFYNPAASEVEGLYRFSLSKGQVITGFQLDLNGKYRDGSIEERNKATAAYNSIVGKRIDPALLQWEGENRYNLRIYPMPAYGSRKITMTIQQMLESRKDFLVYSLPLQNTDTVRQFSLHISANSGSSIPLANEGLISGKIFESSAGNYQLQQKEENILLNRDLSFSIPLRPAICVKPTGNLYNFALRHQPTVEVTYPISPQTITVFWDISASGKKRDLAKEIGFLNQFISRHRIAKMTIVPFNQQLQAPAVFATDEKSNWQSFINKLEYDGATQLSSIDFSAYPADAFLLFSDGNNTYGNTVPPPALSQVYCVNSTPIGNIHVLKQVAGASGGTVIDLAKINTADAVNIFGRSENWLMDIRSTKGKIRIGQKLPVRLNEYLFINGELPNDTDTLLLYYGNNNHRFKTDTVIIKTTQQCTNAAIDRIDMINRFDELLQAKEWQDILEFGLKEKVVTPNTAYLVLERIEDYIRYNIMPPAELEEACLEKGYVKKQPGQVRDALRKSDEGLLLRKIATAYNERIYKWDRNGKGIVLTTRPGETRSGTANPVVFSVPAGSVPDMNNQGNLEEVVVVTGYSVAHRRSMMTASSVVTADQLTGTTSLVQALQGRVPGLQVVQNSGIPGSDLHVVIRGMASVDRQRQPLFVLDGMPVSGDIINLINVQDIASVTVLKDLQATALYGSMAANGAIIINSKKGGTAKTTGRYRLKDMEDVEYLEILKSSPLKEKIQTYKNLRLTHGEEAGFYFDAAQHFFETGLQAQAMTALMNAAEVANGNRQVMRAIGFTLESWGNFAEAVQLYKKLLNDYPADLYLARDLAMAYYQNKEYQQAIDTYYETMRMDMAYQEDYYRQLKSVMLNEMNAIISLHHDELSVQHIPAEMIRPLPVDLRIVLDCNRGDIVSANIKEPGGEECNNGHPVTKSGAWLTRSGNYYASAAMPLEYQVKNAKTGKYKISVEYYDYYSNPTGIPVFIRMVSFLNFGTAAQKIKIENLVLDNQNGMIEIGEIKWR